MKRENLTSGFLRSADAFPDRPALEVAGETLSYRELSRRARSLAATLQRFDPGDGPPLTAVLAYRSRTAFAGVLGALLSGRGYVPLNPRFPPARTASMLARSHARTMIVDRACFSRIDELLVLLDEPLVVVAPDAPVPALARRWPRHRFVGPREMISSEGWEPPETLPQGIAYLLFTSGSTGTPKAVMVTHANAGAFVASAVDRYRTSEQDRFSQTFDMTFDLSVFDMFVAWERGACLCCPTYKELLNPARYIEDKRLSVWFSVPSLGLLMKRLRMLDAGRYGSLRWSLFCGEPLPAELARLWAEAAPASIVENLYGPTELTIACTAYRWDSERSPDECVTGIVPIGWPFPGMEAFVVHGDGKEVLPGEQGELLMTGPQLTPGYWEDPDRTSAGYVTVPHRGGAVYYRTGDLVRQPPSEREPLVFLGRADYQIKVLGHRVELGEVEAVLRDISRAEAAVAIGWPRTEIGAEAISAFLQGSKLDQRAVRASAADRLPPHMVPREIRLLPELPLTANGKIDRAALVRILEEGG